MGYRELFTGNDLFLEVADLYYDRNFGTLSKAEMDLFMFKILYRKMQNETDQTPNEFELAKMLGITNQRVRNLVEKMELKYPEDDELTWQEKVRNLFDSRAVYYDNQNNSFRIFIKDVTLRYDVENYLDSYSFATEYTLNSKEIVLRRGAVLALALECFDEDKKVAIRRAIVQDTSQREDAVVNQLRAKTFWSEHKGDLFNTGINVVKAIIQGQSIDALLEIVNAAARIATDHT